MERARFGIFDFLPSTGELRRNGVPVRLQAQPARVLGALIARPGEVVTRDALQREIWSDGTHVDFERGLNFCIAQVRSALGDSAEGPRYIETVPKQGYRFIAPVAITTDVMAAPVASVPGEATAGPGRHSRRIALAVAAVVVGLLGWVLASLATSSPPTIVVIPFYNETGRPALDPLVQSIGDASVARLASPERTKILSVIGNAAPLKNPFARTDVQKIAHDLGAEWVLIGQLKSDGSGLRVIAHLIRAADMKHLWAQTYDDQAFPLDAQIRTAEAIATAVTGSLRSTPD